MNDSELITAVRESVAGVHLTVPVERIVSRGRAVRARRRMPGAAGAVAAVAGIALAVTALLPAGQASARLAAWTVVKQADGGVRVTIRELRDPAGLQSRLRADGVPARVTFSAAPKPACRITLTPVRLRITVLRLAPAGRRVAGVVITLSPLPGHAGSLTLGRSPAPSLRLTPQIVLTPAIYLTITPGGTVRRQPGAGLVHGTERCAGG